LRLLFSSIRLKLAMLFLVATATAVMAQGGKDGGNKAVLPAGETVDSGRAAMDPTYTVWFDRRLAVAEAQIKEQGDATSDLGLVLALVAVGFGALLTGLIVFFALRTERTAAAAASTAAREEIRTGKAEVDEAVQASRKLLAEAERVLDEIKSNRGQAYEHVASIKAAVEIARRSSTEDPGEGGPAKPALSSAEGEQLRQAASNIVSRPERIWSIEEFKVLLAAAFANNEFERARDLAVAMRTFYQDPPAVAHAMNSEGVALSRLGRTDESLAIYNKIIEQFGASNVEGVQESVAKAMRNRGVRLSARGEKLAALDVYRAAIDRYANSSSPMIRQVRASTLGNASAVAADLNQREQSLAFLRQCYEDFRNDPDIETRVAAFQAGSRASSILSETNLDEAIGLVEEILQLLKGAPEPQFDTARRMATSRLKRFRKLKEKFEQAASATLPAQ
jgi:tetratricopeptide (TPR) repeat protein